MWAVRPTTAAERRADHRQVLRQVETLLAHTPRETPVYLTADDLLEYHGLFDLVKAFAQNGRRFLLITPGLRLADEAFARELSRFPVRLTLSHSTRSADTAARLLGNAAAPPLIESALQNVIRLGMEVSVNTIATSENDEELADLGIFLCEELGLPGFTVPCFYLEQVMLALDPDAPRLYPSYDRVDEQLRTLIHRWQDGRRSISLVDFPPCQFSAEVLSCEWIHWGFPRHDVSPTPAPWDPTCGQCPVVERCNRVPLYYRLRHPGARPDAMPVLRHLASS